MLRCEVISNGSEKVELRSKVHKRTCALQLHDLEDGKERKERFRLGNESELEEDLKKKWRVAGYDMSTNQNQRAPGRARGGVAFRGWEPTTWGGVIPIW